MGSESATDTLLLLWVDSPISMPPPPQIIIHLLLQSHTAWTHSTQKAETYIGASHSVSQFAYYWNLVDPVGRLWSIHLITQKTCSESVSPTSSTADDAWVSVDNNVMIVRDRFDPSSSQWWCDGGDGDVERCVFVLGAWWDAFNGLWFDERTKDRANEWTNGFPNNNIPVPKTKVHLPVLSWTSFLPPPVCPQGRLVVS